MFNLRKEILTILILAVMAVTGIYVTNAAPVEDQVVISNVFTSTVE